MPGDGDRIEIKVKGQDLEEITFRVKRTSRLGKLMQEYGKRNAMPADSFVFLFDGCRVKPEQTPKALEMEHGDTIHAMLPQTGGGGGGGGGAGGEDSLLLPLPRLLA